jgi:hypothetical protein
MTIQFDEKGKIFTNLIAKEAVQATIQTLTHRIHGFVYIRQGERVKDEMDRPERFLAITDASIYDLNGVEIIRTGFLVLSRDQIIWLVPDEDIEQNQGSSGVDE